MLIPRTHTWSPVQKWFILGAVALALLGFGAGVYCYERYHRPPGDDVLFGTWEMTMPHGMDSSDWIALNKDHSFVWFTFGVGGERVSMRGTWFAGGSYLYTRVEGKQDIWQIIQILPDELRLRIAKRDHIFKRDDQKSVPSI